MNSRWVYCTFLIAKQCTRRVTILAGHDTILKCNSVHPNWIKLSWPCSAVAPWGGIYPATLQEQEIFSLHEWVPCSEWCPHAGREGLSVLILTNTQTTPGMQSDCATPPFSWSFLCVSSHGTSLVSDLLNRSQRSCQGQFFQIRWWSPEPGELDAPLNPRWEVQSTLPSEAALPGLFIRRCRAVTLPRPLWGWI